MMSFWYNYTARTTSSPGRFFLALEVGRPTRKAGEKCPTDEVASRIDTSVMFSLG